MTIDWLALMGKLEVCSGDFQASFRGNELCQIFNRKLIYHKEIENNQLYTKFQHCNTGH